MHIYPTKMRCCSTENDDTRPQDARIGLLVGPLFPPINPEPWALLSRGPSHRFLDSNKGRGGEEEEEEEQDEEKRNTKKGTS